MAHTAALPFDFNYEVDYVPVSRGLRHIPAVTQPRFGIVPNAVIPGSGVIPNAFYNPALNFINTSPMNTLTPNMLSNMYLGFIPGLSRIPQL